MLAVQQTQSITGKYHLSLCGVSRREQMEAKALCIDWDIVAGPWDWKEWQSVDRALVDFFLADSICSGPLQNRLRHQMRSLS